MYPEQSTSEVLAFNIAEDLAGYVGRTIRFTMHSRSGVADADFQTKTIIAQIVFGE